MPVPANGLTYTEIYRTDTDAGVREIAVTGLLAKVVVDTPDNGVSCAFESGAADPTQGIIRGRTIDDSAFGAVSVQRADDGTNGVTHFCAIWAPSIDQEEPPSTDL